MVPSRNLELFFSSGGLLFIPIQQDAGGGVQLELVALLESAPAVVVGFGVESDFFLGGLGEIVEGKDCQVMA